MLLGTSALCCKSLHEGVVEDAGKASWVLEETPPAKLSVDKMFEYFQIGYHFHRHWAVR